MNPLHQAVDDYLKLRRGLGYKLEVYGKRLREFNSLLEGKKASHITTKLALEFATLQRHQTPGVRTKPLLIVRGFARFRSGSDPATEVAPPRLLPDTKLRARPYPYSEEEIRRLLEAARNMHSPHKRHRLQPWTYRCLLGLLAVSGMRLGEVLNLRSGDVDWSNGMLTIHKTKFGKSRVIPLHPSTCKELLAYSYRRDRFHAGSPESYFFVSSRGTQLDHCKRPAGDPL